MERFSFNTLLVAIICLLGLYFSYKFGGASLSYYSVRNSISEWQAEGGAEDAKKFQTAFNAASKASSGHPTHPLYQYLTGQVIEWGIVSGHLTPDELYRAKSYYLNAAKLRPTWPVTWASLALVKWRLNNLDDEFWVYLNKADSYGPMQPEVHVLFSKLGLSLYNANNLMFLEIRLDTIKRLSLGLRNSSSRQEILQFINFTNSNETVCRWLKSDEEYITKNILKCSYS